MALKVKFLPRRASEAVVRPRSRASKAIAGAGVADNILSCFIVIESSWWARAPSLGIDLAAGLHERVVAGETLVFLAAGHTVVGARLAGILSLIPVMPPCTNTVSSGRVHNLELLDIAFVAVGVLQARRNAEASGAGLHTVLVVVDDAGVVGAVFAHEPLHHLHGQESEIEG